MFVVDEYEPPILETVLVEFPFFWVMVYSSQICSLLQAEQTTLAFLVAPQGSTAQQAQIIVKTRITQQMMPPHEGAV